MARCFVLPIIGSIGVNLQLFLTRIRVDDGVGGLRLLMAGISMQINALKFRNQ